MDNKKVGDLMWALIEHSAGAKMFEIVEDREFLGREERVRI